MIRTLRRTSQFKRDYKQCIRRHYDMKLIDDVMRDLALGKQLDPKYHDHKLIGDYKGARDCHILNDWILIYNLTGTEVRLLRTGTHSDLLE